MADKRILSADMRARWRKIAQDNPVSHGMSGRVIALLDHIEAMETTMSELSGLLPWLDMKDAPRDRTPVLLKFRDDLVAKFDPEEARGEAWSLTRWQGIQFVGRHPGITDDGFDIGWSFAAPVGQGGFPDAWLVGWRPILPATSHEPEGR